MAFQLNQDNNVESFKAASVIPKGAAVQLNTASPFSIVPASGGSIGLSQVYGIALASAASVGVNVPVQVGGWAPGLAGASLGIGALVSHGIGTAALYPVSPSGVASGLGGPSANTPPRFVVGIALEPAAAGQLFTVAIRPGLEVF